ncbi:MAG TPA: VOC family protein [Kribbella sp.]|nr:VOC family protein [Kribbella sp.]
MSNQVVLRPLRFTADVPAMRRFLEMLGLRSRVESERGGWVDMVAGRGMAALHDAASSEAGERPGVTRLSFEADDIGELAQRLQDAGYHDVTTWDEAYGRVLSVTAPDATAIWVDERSDDLYGYRQHAARPDERWCVTPDLQVRDRAGWQRFLATLGGDSADLAMYRDGSPGAGLVVRLAFRTTESTAEVVQRLTAAGHEPEETATGLVVADPDGQLVTVWTES